MASKRLVVALLVAANLVAGAAVFFFLRPCSIPSAEEDDGDSAAAPCPDSLICLPFSRYVVHWIAFILGCLATRATGTIYKRFADDDQLASTAASKKAGYVAIRDDDPETGGAADGKN